MYYYVVTVLYSLQQVSSRRQSIGTPSSFYSRTPMSSLVDLQEMSLVEQASASVNELKGGLMAGNRRLDKVEEMEEEDDIDLSLNTLLSFGRQITLGMVR